MERIKLFKTKKGFIKFFLIFGITFFLIGLGLLIYSSVIGFKTEFLGGNWNYVIYLSQGIIFILMAYTNYKNDKYFIEWDEKEFRYLLSENNYTETIKLSEIKEIEIQLFEIKILLPDGEKLINLENVGFKDLRKIKGKLEEIKKITERKS